MIPYKVIFQHLNEWTATLK